MKPCNISRFGCEAPCTEGDRCIKFHDPCITGRTSDPFVPYRRIKPAEADIERDQQRIASLPPRILSDLIGVPYRLDGRGPSEYDCAGLFVEVQRRLGILMQIPATPLTVERQAHTMLHILRREWCEVLRPRPGACVFFPQELHVGTVIDGSRFLHTSEELGYAHIDHLDAPQWAHKQRAFYIPAGAR